MRRYPSGFAPVNISLVGKILFGLGIGCVLVRGIDLLSGGFNLPNSMLFFGVASSILGVYLILIGPQVKKTMDQSET